MTRIRLPPKAREASELPEPPFVCSTGSSRQEGSTDDRDRAPSKEKLSLLELAQRFSSEDKARRWFEGLIWPNGERDSPNSGSLDTHECSHPKMPYRCRDCCK